jgi:hypothetical protein
MLFDFDDILIEPELITSIMSRKTVDVTDEKHMLPLFTAPMDTVVDETNSEIFNSLGIYSIIPRKKEIPADYYSTDYKVWYSYGLDDFKKVFIDNFVRINPQDKVYALIDVANGHMDVVKELCQDSKKIYGRQLVLMVGNCANPMTFLSLAQAGADYVRMGIGNGCFIPGSLVQTKSGTIPIEEIQIGDYVLTHKNRYMRVDETFIYERDEVITYINGEGSTGNHEYYVIDKKYKDIINDGNLEEYAEWIPAELLDESNHLLIEF